MQKNAFELVWHLLRTLILMNFSRHHILYFFLIGFLTVPTLTYGVEAAPAPASSSDTSKTAAGETVEAIAADDVIVPAKIEPLSTEDLRLEEELKAQLKDENYALEALDLMHYNIYFHLPKVSKDFDVLYGPYPKVYYGPYEIEKKIYSKPWVGLDEINLRIDVIRDSISKDEKALQASKGEQKNPDELEKPAEKPAEQSNPQDLLYKRVHLADLMTIRSRITGRKDDIREAVRLYAVVFPETSGAFFPYVALNFVNSLLLKQDVITAMPIIKKIYREFRSQKDFMRHLNVSLIDLYFLSDRHQKIWEELEKKIEQRTIDNETSDYKIRVGDILFFMKRYKEAAEWYQAVLKPNPQASLSENVSWLYLAESVWLTGDRDVARKIYEAMTTYFTGTPYEDVINYRLDSSLENAKRIVQYTGNASVRNWLRVEMMRQDFLTNPQNYSLENFNIITAYGKFDEELLKQIKLMKAKYYEIENIDMEALRLYVEVAYDVENQYLAEVLNKAVAGAVIRRGLSTRDEMEAIGFLRFLRKFEFNLRFEEPDRIYRVIMHNMRILGMMDVASGLALHIIDKTVHTPSSKMSIYLKMAINLFDARADKSAVKAMEMIDTGLLDYNDQQKYNRLKTKSLMRLGKYSDTLAFLEEWSAQGKDAEMLYWITLKKVTILEKMERYTDALEVIRNTVGEGKIDELPQEFDAYTDELIAYQVVFNNKIGKNYESLLGFYANKEKALRSKMKLNVILAAVSSALALNKTEDVKTLMKTAKENFTPEIHAWLEKWTRGEMWVNQVSSYLDRKDVATQY